MQQFLQPLAFNSDPPLRRPWFWFAVANLTVGSLMAVVLVLAKTPPLSAWLGVSELFPVALVYHVNFTILLWVASVAVLIWSTCFAPRFALLDRVALALAVAGAVALIGVLGAQPSAVLSNYVPVVDSLWFIAGLLLFVTGVTLVVVNRIGPLFAVLVAEPIDARWLFALAALAWLVAQGVLAAAAFRLPMGASPTADAEVLFWGFGHTLQGVNLMMMVGIWFWLSGHRSSYLVSRCMQWLMIPALVAALVLALAYAPTAPEYRALFTYWMRFFSLPVAVLVVWPVWNSCRRRGGGRPLLVRASVALFVLGVMIGVVIRADNLLVPAHYHATTGALNLMLMLLMYQLRYRSEVVTGRMRRQLLAYLAGVVMMVTGLAVSGWMGIGRKLAGDAPGLDGLTLQAALTLMGAGGAVALMATFVFLLRMARLRAASGLPDVSRRTEVV